MQQFSICEEVIQLNVLISDLVKKYGRVTVLKQNQPDAVLLTIDEFERLSGAFEKSENVKKAGIADLIRQLPEAGEREVYTLAQLKYDLTLSK